MTWDVKDCHMKVLFVSSGNNKKFKIAPFIKSQGDSLKRSHIFVNNFSIRGKGFTGYLKNIFRLKKHLSQQTYDIIHAHYALTGWVVLLAAFSEKRVLSYMGSDSCGLSQKTPIDLIYSFALIFQAFLIQFVFPILIVKSDNLSKPIICKNKLYVLPNGVDFDMFKPLNKNKCRNELGLDLNKKLLLFLGNPESKGKNISLARNAVESLHNDQVELLVPYSFEHEYLALYYNACDALILSSLKEGSSNVVKEAMACNCPIVATDVGDVKWVIGDTPGCYVSTFGTQDVAAKLQQALKYSEKYGSTQGRKRLIALGLDSETIAKRLIDVYKSVLQK